MPRRSRRRSAVSKTQITMRVTGSGSGDAGIEGTHLAAAAALIASGIRRAAASIPSAKIPPSVHVGQATNYTATIYADAPNAYPIETGARHPVFGNRDGPWFQTRQVRFMEMGAAAQLDNAAAEYGKTADDWCKSLGFE